MAETRSKTQLPMEEIRAPADESRQAFQRGVAIGREYAELAVRRASAWAEENPGQLIIAGLAAGFILGKLLYRPRRSGEEL